MTTSLLLTKTAQDDTLVNQSIKEAFIVACEKLDISAIEKLITEADNFEEKGKWSFLSKYKSRFDDIRNKHGVQELFKGTGSCRICYKGQQVVSFRDKKNDIYFGFLFREENNVVVDIWECNSSDGFSRSLIPSQNKPHLQ